MENTGASVGAPIRPYRHEAPLFWILGIFSILIWLVLSLATFGLFLALFLVAGLFALFGHSLLISWLRGNAVRVDADQLPDLHAHYVACCERLRMTKRPDLYVAQADGLLNALATRFLRRYYVVLLSDIVDALEDRPQAVRFYMGHELGHVRHKHLARHWWLWPGRLLPLLSPAYSRAQEYTCDRYGAACCSDPEDARRAMAVLAAGSRLWKHTDLDRFQAQSQQTGGFWMAVNELTGHYPWLCKRMAAVADPDVRFPRRSLWAWIIAFLSPPFGYGSALLGFINTLIVGTLLAAIVFFAASGPDALRRAIGSATSAVAGMGAMGRGGASSHERHEGHGPAAPGFAQDADADEVLDVLKTASLAVERYAASRGGLLPDTLEDADVDPSATPDNVGAMNYTVTGLPRAHANISLDFFCKTCVEGVGTLVYTRNATARWSCSAVDMPDDIRPRACKSQ